METAQTRFYAAQLEATGAAIQALAQGVTDEQAGWRPAPGQWSILEVVCHLYDEEREDFRLRLEMTLHRPDEPLPPIDPEGWVEARGYARRSLPETLADFAAERRASVAWLRALEDERWGQPANHPHLGGMRAGDFLASWAAHDLLHIRQLNELRYAFLERQAAPYSVEYAGGWEG